MDVVTSVKPLYAILISLIAVGLILAFPRKPTFREFFTVISALVTFVMVLSMLPWILQGGILEYHIITVLPGLNIALQVDALGMVFALTASFLWLVTSFYTIGYMRSHYPKDYTGRSVDRFFAFFLIAMTSAIGTAFAGNLFTLYIFYEILTLCTYPLVAYDKTQEALYGAQKYLIHLLGTSLLFFLPAMFLTYYYTGTLDFSTSGILAGNAPDIVLVVTFILFIAGIAKAALMPFHAWLPAAMVAPTPVSALLHAVAVVKAGVFTIIRVVLFIFGADLVQGLNLGYYLAYFAAFTIIVASLIALRQDNLKRRLAYSTISQLSYTILGVALLTPSAITGSVLHLVIHAFGKITLFFAAGAIYVASGKTEISQMNGIGKKMPFTMAAFTIGALSMISIPPAAGFLSKWYLTMGAVEANQLALVAVLALSSLLNAAYFLPIVYRAFLKPVENGEKVKMKEAPAFMVGGLMITAIAVLCLFFAPSVFLELARMIVAAM
ncbi:MAG: monovalent cation/H+ antiporter subunit D family protein [Syntrophomonadaceae bacterium]|nr:monovalent cation/H+ antiporter subunit D family protein [Syntrophomonadaceae bacterium]NLX02726.1 monovalent cation/H+ antiporter subunit D family protein [Syntrophomonadaceae bacterium]